MAIRVLTAGRSRQENAIQFVGFHAGAVLFTLFRNDIGHQNAIHSRRARVASQGFQPVLEYGIEIAEKQQRHIRLFADAFNRLQIVGHPVPVKQRPGTGALNYGPIGHRIREWYPQFDNVRTGSLQFRHQPDSGFQIGIARHDKRNECLRSAGLRVPETSFQFVAPLHMFLLW